MTVRTTGGGGSSSPSAPTYVQLLGLMGSIGGLGTYQSPIHFNAVFQAATALDLSGHPSITDISQFRSVVAISSAGIITTYDPSSYVFSWDSVNDRLTVTGAAFTNTDVFVVSIAGSDRYANTPGDFWKMSEVNPFPLQSDDAIVPLITAAQDFTAGWIDLGSEIPLFGKNKLKLWLTFNINDSIDLRVRVVEKHENGGTEEFPAILEVFNAADIRFQPGYWEMEVDADTLAPLIFRSDGMTPYVQVQIMAGTLGVGTDATMDAAGYTRGTFGG